VTIFEVCLGGDLYGDTVVIVWAESRKDAIAAAGAAVRKHDTIRDTARMIRPLNSSSGM
jgi:hypothetical protein